jgi:hypothetical protein
LEVGDPIVGAPDAFVEGSGVDGRVGTFSLFDCLLFRRFDSCSRDSWSMEGPMGEMERDGGKEGLERFRGSGLGDREIGVELFEVVGGMDIVE